MKLTEEQVEQKAKQIVERLLNEETRSIDIGELRKKLAGITDPAERERIVDQAMGSTGRNEYDREALIKGKEEVEDHSEPEDKEDLV